MNIRFFTLTIQCRESREVISLSPQITFFHGQTGAGKSSIARMIDFCLGGSLEKTPAVRKEVISVSLDVQLGDRRCVLERESIDSNQVHVNWTDTTSHEHHLLAPIQPSNTPILGENVFNLSDLIFKFCGVTPPKVRRSKSDEESPLIRLSFRDVMWYCYLDQNHLDSSFFRLSEPIFTTKSRDVMRFIVGYYTERLQDLEITLDTLLHNRDAKIETTKQMRAFLDRLGYGTEQQIRKEIVKIQDELHEAEQKRVAVCDSYQANTHFADTLRQKLRAMSDTLDKEEQVRTDLYQRLADQQALRAELVTARVKLARQESASSILQGVVFAACPLCGTPVDSAALNTLTTHCLLCKSDPMKRPAEVEAAHNEEIKRDLECRIEELEESIERAKRAVLKQEEIIETIKAEKSAQDQRLVVELRDYDSAFVADVRELDRQVATLKERLKNLDRMKILPDAIEQLLREVDQSCSDEERIRREMDSERQGLTTADEVIEDVEKAYLQALVSVGVPGVKPTDTVQINRRNWIPFIREGGDEELAWSFFDTGSGGKKTLLNVCYALAIHQVAVQRSLPLPTFLIIDTPMKNISEDVNRDIFEAFYRYLYEVAKTDMARCQIIIIDKEYIQPAEGIEIVERYMTPDQVEHPPLIPYYRGA